MKKLTALVFLALVFAVSMALAQWYEGPSEFTNEPPLPQDLTIQPPGAAVPAQLAKFSGIWDGSWSNGQCVTIAIERIAPPTVVAIYAIGAVRTTKGIWHKIKGTVTGDKIFLRWGRKDSVRTVTLQATGDPREIKATFERETRSMEARLRKR